jgi:hypothetical protein
VDLVIRQGADFLTTLTFTNPDASAVDLTGCRLAAQIRKKPRDVASVANFTFVVATPTTGVATMSMAAAVTATILCGDSLQDPASEYHWDLELTDSLGKISSPLHGKVSVFREVTR